MPVLAVIPARLGATRLPRKPLRLLGGLPLVVRVYERVVSLGVADLWPSDNGESWFSRADEALYTSKREGRNRVTAPTSLARHATSGGRT